MAPIAPKTESSFKALADPGLFPVLARAIENISPLNNTQVEWLVDSETGPEVWLNYTQIFRKQFHANDDHTLKTSQFLSEIEWALVEGKPFKEGWVSTMGGYKHYLGREINDDDELRLRPLREPILSVFEQDEFGMYLDNPKMEWLAETSLVVIPG